MGCTLAWSRDVHWFATRVAEVGTSNKDSERQQCSCSTRHPMLDALRHRRDKQVPEDLFMDLDAPPLKRSRDTPSSTRFTKSNEFAQRAQTASVPLPRTSEPVVLAPDTTIASQRRSHAFDATISKFSRRREGARDATCGKFEISRARAIIILSPCAARQTHTHVAHGSHVRTRIDESDRETARSHMIHFSLTTLL